MTLAEVGKACYNVKTIVEGVVRMSERKHHRGRRKKSNFLLNIILVIAVIVFCVSGYNLLKIGKGYKDGQNEYEKIRKLAVTQDKDS